MGDFTTPSGVSASTPDFLSEAYVEVIGSKWGIYRGKSHMPFGDTLVEEFDFKGRRYKITVWPNDEQDIIESDRFWTTMVESMIKPHQSEPILAVGIFNYSVPWLDWYVRVRDSAELKEQWPVHPGDKWVELSIVQSDKYRASSAKEWKDRTERERLQHYDWMPSESNPYEGRTSDMIARVQGLVEEYENTNVTYLIIQDMGPLRGWAPLNWCYLNSTTVSTLLNPPLS